MPMMRATTVFTRFPNRRPGKIRRRRKSAVRSWQEKRFPKWFDGLPVSEWTDEQIAERNTHLYSALGLNAR